MKFDMSGGAGGARGASARSPALRLPVRVVAVVGATENLPQRPRDEAGRRRHDRRAARRSRSTTPTPRAASCSPTACARRRARAPSGSSTSRRSRARSSPRWARPTRAAGPTTTLGGRGRRRRGRRRRARLAAAAARRVRGAGQGRHADLANAPGRKAGPIPGAEFLQRFTGDVPWAHLDIAGTAWDGGRAYAPRAARATACACSRPAATSSARRTSLTRGRPCGLAAAASRGRRSPASRPTSTSVGRGSA